MLALYGKIYGVDNQTACKEIKDALGRDEKAPEYQVKRKEVAPKEPEIENAKPASDEVKHKTYTMCAGLLSGKGRGVEHPFQSQVSRIRDSHPQYGWVDCGGTDSLRPSL